MKKENLMKLIFGALVLATQLNSALANSSSELFEIRNLENDKFLSSGRGFSGGYDDDDRERAIYVAKLGAMENADESCRSRVAKRSSDWKIEQIYSCHGTCIRASAYFVCRYE